MTRNLLWLALVIVTALLQSTWPDFLRLQDVLPDLVLLLVVYFALFEGEERAMFTALVGGIYQDVASNAVLGHHVVGHLVVAFFLGRISNRLISEHPMVKTAFVLMAGLASGVIFTLIGYIQYPDIQALYTIFTSVVPAAFYTAILTPVVFALLNFIFHRRESAERGMA